MANLVAGRWSAIRFVFYLFVLTIGVSFVWFLAKVTHNDGSPTAHQLVIDINQGIIKLHDVAEPNPVTSSHPVPENLQASQPNQDSGDSSSYTGQREEGTAPSPPPVEKKPAKPSIIETISKLIDPNAPFIISYCKGDWASNAIIELAKHIRLPNVQVLQDPGNANIGIRSAWGHCEKQSTAKLNFFIDMESHGHGGDYPVITTVRPPADQDPKYAIWVPYAFFHFPQRLCCKPEDLVTPKVWNETAKKEILASKTKFTVFAARYCDYGHGDMERTKFFDRLSKDYEQADSISGCRNNARPPSNIPPILDNDRDQPIAWFAPYKFAIVFENTGKRGYFTEKLINAALAKTVPIYWGPPDIAEHINMESIVHCEPEEDNSFKSCIEEIRILDNDDEQYLEKLAQPLFKNNSLPDYMKWEPLVERVMEIYKELVLDKQSKNQ